MFYELRQYKVLPGKMDAWLELMEGEFIPFAVSHGMNITAAFRGEEDETVYVWMRRFESEAERERVDAAVYGSDTMKNDIGPRVSDVLAPDGTHRDAHRADAGVQHAMSLVERLRRQVIADYERRTPGSRALFERAVETLPGGVSGNLRFFPPYPLYMATGRGCRTVDVDGSAYIDSFACNGPLLLGHRHPAVVSSVERHAGVGSLVLNPELAVECAERLKEVIPSAERVRFLNSGTEAVMTAVRYARAYTGKPKVVKFQGQYHGQDDQFLLGLGADRRAFSAGVPESSQDGTLTLPFDDVEALDDLLGTRDDVAAVIVDPAMHAGGLWGVTGEFLGTLRRRTRDAGVVLIFDEVITGFRLALGGAQAWYGITPDLTTLAKALSAGDRLAAVVGRADIMEVTDPRTGRDVPRAFQSGTGNDGTSALAAALGAIGEYERLERAGEYDALAGRIEGLEAALLDAFEDHGIAVRVNRVRSLLQCFVADPGAPGERDARLNGALLYPLHLALVNEGVLLALPGSDHSFFSFLHDQPACDEIADAVRTVLGKYPFAEAYQEASREKRRDRVPREVEA